MSVGGPARDTQHARTLADALWTAAAEEAVGRSLSEGCVVGALTLLLGKAVGTIARARGYDLAQYTAFIMQEFRKIAWAEHRGRPWPMQ